jgi:hypothetical protein
MLSLKHCWLLPSLATLALGSLTPPTAPKRSQEVLSSAPPVAPPKPENTSFNLLLGPTTTTVSSLSMETEDLSGLPASGDYADGSESNKLHNSNYGPIDHQPINSRA